MYGIDRCPTKITRFVFILFVVELCAMDQIFYMDEHVIQGVTLPASLIMLVIALLTEVFIGRITQSVYTAMICHFTTAAGVYLNNKKQPCYQLYSVQIWHSLM